MSMHCGYFSIAGTQFEDFRATIIHFGHFSILSVCFWGIQCNEYALRGFQYSWYTIQGFQWNDYSFWIFQYTECMFWGSQCSEYVLRVHQCSRYTFEEFSVLGINFMGFSAGVMSFRFQPVFFSRIGAYCI